jgi:hypothetical protein
VTFEQRTLQYLKCEKEQAAALKTTMVVMALM